MSMYGMVPSSPMHPQTPMVMNPNNYGAMVNANAMGTMPIYGTYVNPTQAMMNNAYTMRQMQLAQQLQGFHQQQSGFDYGVPNEGKKKRSSAKKPPRIDSETEMAQWFVCGVPRAEVRGLAKAMLKNGVVGNFLVRDVESDPDCLGLTVLGPDGISNYLIEKVKHDRHIDGQGFRMRGTKHIFPTISDLVHYFCDMPRPPFNFKFIPLDLDGRAGRMSVPRVSGPSTNRAISLGEARPAKSKAPKQVSSSRTDKLGRRFKSKSPEGAVNTIDETFPVAVIVHGTAGKLEFRLSEGASTNLEDGVPTSICRYEAKHIGPVSEIRIKLTKSLNAALAINGLHISSTAGIQCKLGRPVEFSAGPAGRHIVAAMSGTVPFSSQATPTGRDVATASEVKRLLAMRVKGPGATVKAVAREPRPSFKPPTLEQQRDTQATWLTELDTEELRILQTLDQTEAEIEALRHDDINGAVVTNEVAKRVSEIEESRNELSAAAVSARAQLAAFESAKKKGSKRLDATDDVLAKLHDQLLVSETALKLSGERVEECEAEHVKGQQHIKDLETQDLHLSKDETAIENAITEAEHKLAALLVEERKIRTREKTQDMAAANVFAAEQLRQMELARAISDLELEQRRHNAEDDDLRARELLRRTHVQELLEADVLGIDSLITDPDIGIHDETKLAAAESQVRMLEEKLMLAEAHLRFAETTAALIEQFPESQTVLLRELEEYEKKLEQAGGVVLGPDDEAFSDYDSEVDDSGSPLWVDSSVISQPSVSHYQDRYIELYHMLQSSGGSVQIEHVREIFVLMRANDSIMESFSRRYPELTKVVTEQEFIDILTRYGKHIPQLVNVVHKDDSKDVPDLSRSPDEDTSQATFDTDIENNSALPEETEDNNFGFPDDEVSENPLPTEKTHVKHLMRVWQLRDQAQAPARRLSKELQKDLENQQRAR